MSILREIFRIVGRLLPESVCRLCGYDNPYMDPVDDYVCRQCTQRAEKWGTGNVAKAPPAPASEPAPPSSGRPGVPKGTRTLKNFISMFDNAFAKDKLEYIVDYDAGHAYNAYTGPVFEHLDEMAQKDLSDDEYDLFDEYTSGELGESDSAACICPPKLLEDIATAAGLPVGYTGDGCWDDQCATPEGAVETLENFMDQVRNYSGDAQETARREADWHFDLVQKYVDDLKAKHNLP